MNKKHSASTKSAKATKPSNTQKNKSASKPQKPTAKVSSTKNAGPKSAIAKPKANKAGSKESAKPVSKLAQIKQLFSKNKNDSKSAEIKGQNKATEAHLKSQSANKKANALDSTQPHKIKDKARDSEKEASKIDLKVKADAIARSSAAVNSTSTKGASAKGKGLGGRSRSASAESVCREVACDGLATTGHYCRLHYIKNWKKIKRKEVILAEGKLIQYIEELVSKYPDKYIDAIQQDLLNDKDFAKVIYDLELDDSIDDFEGDSENEDVVVDSIRRDFDDESDAF